MRWSGNLFSSCLPCEDLPRTTIISVAVPTFEVGMCHTFLVYPWKMFSRYSFCSKEDLFCIHIDEKSGDSLPRCACFSDLLIVLWDFDEKTTVLLPKCTVKRHKNLNITYTLTKRSAFLCQSGLSGRRWASLRIDPKRGPKKACTL